MTPVLGLFERPRLQVREAEVEGGVVHRLPRAEALENSQRALHERLTEVDPLERDVAVAEVVRSDSRLAREALALALEPGDGFLEEVPRALEPALVQLQVRREG